MTRRRQAIIAAGSFAVLLCFYVLATGRLILNGSGSLPHNAYFMVTWPKAVFDGVYVALKTPEALKPTLGDLPLVKQVQGIAGGHLVHRNESVCIDVHCFKPEHSSGENTLKLTPTQTIPPGHFAAFGTSANSLDSRYETIGLFHKDDVIAVGFPIPFPHRTEVQAWLEK